MTENWKVTHDWVRPQCIARIVIPSGTELVSRDGGRTYRFKGMEALTVLVHDDVIDLAKKGILRSVR